MEVTGGFDWWLFGDRECGQEREPMGEAQLGRGSGEKERGEEAGAQALRGEGGKGGAVVLAGAAGVVMEVEGSSGGKGGGGGWVVGWAILWFTNIKGNIQLREQNNLGSSVKMIVFGHMMFIAIVKHQQHQIMLKFDFI